MLFLVEGVEVLAPLEVELVELLLELLLVLEDLLEILFLLVQLFLQQMLLPLECQLHFRHPSLILPSLIQFPLQLEYLDSAALNRLLFLSPDFVQLILGAGQPVFQILYFLAVVVVEIVSLLSQPQIALLDQLEIVILHVFDLCLIF